MVKKLSSRKRRTWTDAWLEEMAIVFYNPFSVTCAGSKIYKMEIMLRAVGLILDQEEVTKTCCGVEQVESWQANY